MLSSSQRPSVHAMRQFFLTANDLLSKRQAAKIPEEFLEAYVQCDWMKWHGGGLRLTTVGSNIRDQLMAAVNGSDDSHRIRRLADKRSPAARQRALAPTLAAGLPGFSSLPANLFHSEPATAVAS